VFTERTSVGLDVHARSVAAAGLDTVTGEVWERKLRPGSSDILSWLSGLAGPVAVTYDLTFAI
jgi:transposase